MKTILSLIVWTGILASGMMPLFAQSNAVQKGSIMIGGNASVESQKVEDDDDRQTSINVSPNAEYFIIPGLSVGGHLHFGYTSFGDNHITSLGIGPSATYYFSHDERDFYPYVSGNVRTMITDTGEDNSSSYGFTAAAGVMKLINRNVGLTGEVHFIYDDYEQTSSTRIGLSLGIRTFFLR